VDKPVCLQRFPEVSRRMRWDVGADFRYFPQFLLSLRISFMLGHLSRLLRVAFNKSNDGVANGHALQFLLLVVRVKR
jgi:hypothetical protein